MATRGHARSPESRIALARTGNATGCTCVVPVTACAQMGSLDVLELVQTVQISVEEEAVGSFRSQSVALYDEV